jgi:two-component system, cell cycle response regulator
MAARVLLIEDNPTNLALVGYLLKAYGHTVLTAIDGEQGLEAVRSEVPDLIICDVQIPKLDGYKVAKQLKHHPTLCKIPLIAVTALAMVGDRERMLAAGFDGYIPKPIDPETFVPEVEAFLHSTHSSPHHPAPLSAIPPPRRPANPASATILVVDNSAVNLSLMQITLEPFHHVICAYDAAEALTLMRQTPPDLILSDVHMPGQDGYALIRAVKADPQLRAIPFVFISSTLWPERDRETGLALGAVKFIVRPIETRALLAEIDDCLQQESGGDRL